MMSTGSSPVHLRTATHLICLEEGKGVEVFAKEEAMFINGHSYTRTLAHQLMDGNPPPPSGR